MEEERHYNRRITSRYEFNIIGDISILVNNERITEKIDIIDISYKGLKVVFSDNTFLYHFLMFVDEQDKRVTVNFIYNEKSYVFENSINWLKLYKFGERHYYVLTGLLFENRESIEETVTELLLELQMKNIYLG